MGEWMKRGRAGWRREGEGREMGKDREIEGEKEGERGRRKWKREREMKVGEQSEMYM